MEAAWLSIPCGNGVRELSSVGKHDFYRQHDRGARLRRTAGNRDAISRFKHISVIACVSENRGAAELAAPVHRITFVVLNVEEDLAMWIRPHKFGDGARQFHR